MNHASFGNADGIHGLKNQGGGNQLSIAQQKVNQTKMQMEMNVQKMIQNQDELGDIENRAGELKNIAFNMKNSAD